MTDRELMQQALEALKLIDEAMPFPVAKLVMKNLRERLAQPEQEPVAWNVINPVGKVVATEKDAIHGWARLGGFKPTLEGLLGFHDQGWRVVPSIAPQPRQWVGLTDEEIAEGQRQSWVDKQAFESAAWWTEAKLREKNA